MTTITLTTTAQQVALRGQIVQCLRGEVLISTDISGQYDLLSPGADYKVIGSDSLYAKGNGVLRILTPDSYNTGSVSGGQSTAKLIRKSEIYTIDAGASSLAIANTGTADILVTGNPIKPKESVSFQAPNGGTLGSIAIDATGSEALIIEVRK